MWTVLPHKKTNPLETLPPQSQANDLSEQKEKILRDN